MVDKRDKRFVYMSTFQKRLDRIDTEMMKQFNQTQNLTRLLQTSIDKNNVSITYLMNVIKTTNTINSISIVVLTALGILIAIS